MPPQLTLAAVESQQLPWPGGSIPFLDRLKCFRYPSINRHGQPTSRLAVRLGTVNGGAGSADMPWYDKDGDLPRCATIARSCLHGQALTEIPALWDRLEAVGVGQGFLAALDVALWDLLGRLQNLPVHRLFGTGRTHADVYVHTPFNLSLDQYIELARAVQDEGFLALKIHPTIDVSNGWKPPLSGDPERDLEICRAVRSAVGPAFPLMLDNYTTYDFPTALRVGRELERLNFQWFESPTPETDEWIEPCARLARELIIPVCGPENAPGHYRKRIEWLERGACDIGRMEIYCGGFTPCLRFAAACMRQGRTFDLHTFGEFYHLQVLGATPPGTLRFFESGTLRRDDLIIPESSARTGPICLPGRLTAEPRADATGQVPIPQTPGMGIDLDWDYIQAHATIRVE